MPSKDQIVGRALWSLKYFFMTSHVRNAALLIEWLLDFFIQSQRYNQKGQ